MAIIKEADEKAIKSAAESLKAGEIVAFPTETVYGLAADAKNPKAIERIYEIKQRPADLALQIMVSSVAEAGKIAHMDERAEKLMAAFCPGPLTIILKRKNTDLISPDVAKGKGTIGIRIPDHPVAQKLLREFGAALATTSANLSGEKDSITAHDVEKSLGGKIPMILDGGESSLGISSSVVDLSSREIKILRHGHITAEQIKNIIGSP